MEVLLVKLKKMRWVFSFKINETADLSRVFTAGSCSLTLNYGRWVVETIWERAWHYLGLSEMCQNGSNFPENRYFVSEYEETFLRLALEI